MERITNVGAQDEYDDHIRDVERKRIAVAIKAVANDILRDRSSDAIDGFVAAAMLDLAGTIETNGNIAVAIAGTASGG